MIVLSFCQPVVYRLHQLFFRSAAYWYAMRANEDFISIDCVNFLQRHDIRFVYPHKQAFRQLLLHSGHGHIAYYFSILQVNGNIVLQSLDKEDIAVAYLFYFIIGLYKKIVFFFCYARIILHFISQKIFGFVNRFQKTLKRNWLNQI